MPTSVKLKDPGTFKIIGREKLPRLDARAKSTGTQQFAIDVMLPGMMTAVVMRPPRFGGKVQSFDATKAKAVPGVVDVVQIPRGVAVVGRDMWSAKKGRDGARGHLGRVGGREARHRRADEGVPRHGTRQGGGRRSSTAATPTPRSARCPIASRGSSSSRTSRMRPWSR